VGEKNKSIQRQGKKQAMLGMWVGKAHSKMKGFCSTFVPTKVRKNNTVQRFFLRAFFVNSVIILGLCAPSPQFLFS
jgi:hypothetical protein